MTWAVVDVKIMNRAIDVHPPLSAKHFQVVFFSRQHMSRANDLGWVDVKPMNRTGWSVDRLQAEVPTDMV